MKISSILSVLVGIQILTLNFSEPVRDVLHGDDHLDHVLLGVVLVVVGEEHAAAEVGQAEVDPALLGVGAA